MTKVNLLPGKARFGLSRLNFARRLRIMAVLFLVIFVIWAGAVLAVDRYLFTRTQSVSLQIAVNENRLAEFLPKLNLLARSRTRIKHASEIITGQDSLPFEVVDLYSLLGKETKITSFNYKSGAAMVVVEMPGLRSLAKLEKNVGRLNQAGGTMKYELIDAQSISMNDQGAVQLSLKIIPSQ